MLHAPDPLDDRGVDTRSHDEELGCESDEQQHRDTTDAARFVKEYSKGMNCNDDDVFELIGSASGGVELEVLRSRC